MLAILTDTACWQDPKTKESAEKTQNQTSTLVTPWFWKCLECQKYQRRDGERCQETKGCRGRKRNEEGDFAVKADAAKREKEKEKPKSTEKSEEAGGGLGDDDQTYEAAKAAAQTEYDNLTNAITALEAASQIALADSLKVKRTKIKWPSPPKPLKDRASMTAKLAQYEEKHQKDLARLQNLELKHLKSQDENGAARDRELEELKRDYDSKVALVQTSFNIAEKVSAKNLATVREDILKAKETYQKQVEDLNLKLEKLERTAGTAGAAAATGAVQQVPVAKHFVTADQLQVEEVQQRMMQQGWGIAQEDSIKMTNFFFELLNMKATANMKLPEEPSGAGEPSGSNRERADGLGLASQQEGGGESTSTAADEEMTDVSESEDDRHIRELNAGNRTPQPPMKIKMKASAAKEVRARRLRARK